MSELTTKSSDIITAAVSTNAASASNSGPNSCNGIRSFSGAICSVPCPRCSEISVTPGIFANGSNAASGIEQVILRKIAITLPGDPDAQTAIRQTRLPVFDALRLRGKIRHSRRNRSERSAKNTRQTHNRNLKIAIGSAVATTGTLVDTRSTWREADESVPDLQKPCVQPRPV